MRARFISFHYTVRDREGKVLSSTHQGDPMMFLEGNGQIMPALENQIKKMKEGDKKEIFVACSDAYGTRDEKLVLEVPIEQLPGGARIKPGSQFSLNQKDGTPLVYRVIEINHTHARLDGNHPLAGKDLLFEVEVRSAREALNEVPAFEENTNGPSKLSH